MMTSLDFFKGQIDVMNALYKTLEHFFPSPLQGDKQYWGSKSRKKSHLPFICIELGSHTSVSAEIGSTTSDQVVFEKQWGCAAFTYIPVNRTESY